MRFTLQIYVDIIEGVIEGQTEKWANVNKYFSPAEFFLLGNMKLSLAPLTLNENIQP